MLSALSDNEAKLLVGLTAVAGVILGLLGSGLGFIVKRWFVGAKQKERLDYISGLADLKIKLREAGLSMDEVREVGGLLANPTMKASERAQEIVAEIKEDMGRFGPHDTNVAIQIRTGAAYEVANAQLQQALVGFGLTVDEADWTYVEKIQDAWKQYRSALEDWAYHQYEGGTHAPLAMTAAGLAETERRTKEILDEASEFAAR